MKESKKLFQKFLWFLSGIALAIGIEVSCSLPEAMADQVIGVYRVNYRNNAGAPSPLILPVPPEALPDSNGYNTGVPSSVIYPSPYPPGPIAINATPGRYRVTAVANGGNGGNACVWSGDATGGTFFYGTAGYEFDHKYGQIVFFAYDWYVGDNSPNSWTDVELVKVDTVPTLTKVGIYYQHDIALSGYPGYPTTDTPVTIRAIVWAKDSPNGVEKPYTKENWSAGEWYNPGIDGATVNFNPSPQSLPAISEWPNNWPQIDFEWKALFHQANTKNTTGYNKNYEEKEYSNPFWSGGWGYDNTLPRGTWRFKVKAILNKGTPDEQSVDSLISNNNNLAKEYATRISVLDNSLSVVYGLNYLKWLTAYLAVPYEWGGHWFGGKEGQNVGGADSYDGFATDCSGLVSCGARWSGYNWNSGGSGLWRATTWSLANGLPDDPKVPGDDSDPTYYSTKIDAKLLAPGDILNRVTQYIPLPNGKKKKLGGHVVSIYEIKSYNKSDGTPDKIKIISAEGSPLNRVLIQDVNFKKYHDEKYVPRRLTQH